MCELEQYLMLSAWPLSLMQTACEQSKYDRITRLPINTKPDKVKHIRTSQIGANRVRSYSGKHHTIRVFGQSLPRRKLPTPAVVARSVRVLAALAAKRSRTTIILSQQTTREHKDRIFFSLNFQPKKSQKSSATHSGRYSFVFSRGRLKRISIGDKTRVRKSCFRSG